MRARLVPITGGLTSRSSRPAIACMSVARLGGLSQKLPGRLSSSVRRRTGSVSAHLAAAGRALYCSYALLLSLTPSERLYHRRAYGEGLFGVLEHAIGLHKARRSPRRRVRERWRRFRGIGSHGDVNPIHPSLPA